MLIGEIAGGVVSLQAPSRRNSPSVLGLREDGWVSLIDVARSDSRVRWAWTGLSGHPPAAAAGWLTTEVPVVLTAEGSVVTLNRAKCRRDGLAVLGEEGCGRRSAPAPESLGMVTRQQCQAGGPPFVVTVDDVGAYWWSASQDLQPIFDSFRAWPNSEQLVRGPGVVLPWVNAKGFVKLVTLGSDTVVFLVTCDAQNPVLSVTRVGAVTTDGVSEYKALGGLPTPGGVGTDFCLACPDRVLLVRLRPGRPVETVVVVRPEPGRVVTSVDLRNGLGLLSTAGRGGGTAELFDPASGRRLWQFDLDLGVSDVTLVVERERTCALAVDTDGGVHLWTINRGEGRQGSTPLSGPVPTSTAQRGLELG